MQKVWFGHLTPRPPFATNFVFETSIKFLQKYILRDALLLIYSTWSCHVSLLLMMSQRSLLNFPRSISDSSILRWGSVSSCRPKYITISLVLSVFVIMLFWSVHIVAWSAATWISLSTLCTHTPPTLWYQLHILSYHNLFWGHLTGLKGVPCGTPDFICFYSDVVLPIFMTCFLSHRKFVIHLIRKSGSPAFAILGNIKKRHFVQYGA